MKKLFICAIALLVMGAGASCDSKSIREEAYENYSIFTLTEFEGKSSFKMSRIGLDDGQIYYRYQISQGEVTIEYDLGWIHEAEEVATLSESAELIEGWGGYVYGDQVTIVFEADVPTSGKIIIAFLPFAVYPDNLHKHEHTYMWKTTETTHQMVYTCGCAYSDIAEVHLDANENGYCDRCDYFVGLNTFPEPEESNLLRDCLGMEWLYQVRAEKISEISMTVEAAEVKPGNMKYLDRTMNEELISYLFDSYYRLEVTPITLEDGQVDGGSLLTVFFHLNDGTLRKLSISNCYYRDENNAYYRLLYVPTISDYYDSPAEEHIESGYLFVTESDRAMVYTYDEALAEKGEKICEIEGIDRLAFVCEWVDGLGMPTHIIETEFGVLEVYGEQYFRYGDAIYKLIAGDFYEIFKNGVVA